MKFLDATCHPERSEGSVNIYFRLRYDNRSFLPSVIRMTKGENVARHVPTRFLCMMYNL